MTAWHHIHTLDIGAKLFQSNWTNKVLRCIPVGTILFILGVLAILCSLGLKLDLHDIAQRFNASAENFFTFRLGTDPLDLVAGQ